MRAFHSAFATCVSILVNSWRAAPALLLWVLPLGAQMVSGRVRDESTGSALATVFVALYDTAGARVAAGLTSGDGRYSLHAPTPGSYLLKAELIGYDEYQSPAPLDVGTAEATEHDVVLSLSAIPLTGIEVEGKSRCEVRPAEGVRTAQVWSEARKALQLAAWTESAKLVRYRLTNYRTVVDARTERVVDEERSTSAGYSAGSPYQSLDPDDLVRDGYVRAAEGGGWLYYAPDAEVLLSDAFLDGHCFQLVEHETDGTLLGLAFRPVSRGRTSDIQGVLWLNRTNSRLERMEFSYTRLPFPVESEQIGGDATFERLPEGPWIIRSWEIRAPEVALDRMGRVGRVGSGAAQDRYRVVRIDETGGVVEQVLMAPGLGVVPDAAPTSGTISGIVLEPTGSAGVADARVVVVGVPDTITTGPDGRFRVDGLRPGLYRLRVEPPGWDAPWSPPTTTDVTVAGGSVHESEIHLSSPGAVVEEWCGATPQHLGVLFGRVLHPETGAPLPQVDVVVTWNRITAPGRTSEWEALSGTSDPNGWYRICGVPSDEALRVRAVPANSAPDRTARALWRPDARLPRDARELSLGEELRARIDLRPADVGSAAGPIVVTATARAVDERSRGGLVGASVTLLTLGDTVIDEALTGANGFFSVSAAPGEYRVRVKLGGYQAGGRDVTLEPGVDTLPAFVLQSSAMAIEGLTVEADRSARVMEDIPASARPFQLLSGRRLAELERVGASFTSAVARMGAGVWATNVWSNEIKRSLPCIQSSRTGIPSIRGGGSRCQMVAIILDGVDTGLSGLEAQLWLQSVSLSQFESISFLSGLDAQTRYGMHAGSQGALILWTRGRGPHLSKERGGG
ncbi:MAG: carboxypeptidase-like regulatory domain-containing protein [Gemmatimonadetes bacterium]|nr:carboxypeptidase-like regulatory domain-containing protein [Gemmatimonadota bacterium]